MDKLSEFRPKLAPLRAFAGNDCGLERLCLVRTYGGPFIVKSRPAVACGNGILPVNSPRPGWPCHGGHRVVTSAVEHSSGLNYCMALSNGGFIPPPS